MPTTSITGGATHNVSVYGNGTVVAGGGNDLVRLQGSGNITVGDGNDRIAVGGNATINAGSGNDQISVLGGGQISVGGGHDTISLLGSGQIVQAGALGADTITLGTANDTVIVQGQATVSHYSPIQPRLFGHGFLGGNAYPSAGLGGATVVGGELRLAHSGAVMEEIAVSGTMTLAGGSSPIELFGGSGSTLMRGASGHDTFVGGSGHDTMTAVGNQNVFDFVASEQGGQHLITNFVSGDQLTVDGESLAYLIANNQVTTHGGNTYISADGGNTTIELQGVVAGTAVPGARVPPPAAIPHRDAGEPKVHIRPELGDKF